MLRNVYARTAALRCAILVAAAGAALALDVAPMQAEEVLSVRLDQAKIIRMPDRVATIVIGNPLIADVSIQHGGVMVLTGKGYGTTNVVAMDQKGAVVYEGSVQVDGPTDKIVTVYRGVERESYSCTPACQRRMMIGDSPTYFTSNVQQTGVMNTQAAASVQLSSR